MSILIMSSMIISALVTAASLLGIFNPATYRFETANWTLQAIGQDMGNLIAVIVFVITTFYLSQKSSKAFFIWIGALFYFIYAYLIYSFFVHFNFFFLVYTAILGLCVYTTIGGLAKFIQNIKLNQNKYARFASLILIVTGVLFILLWLSEIIPALISGNQPASLKGTGLWVNPIHVIDLSVVLPGMVSTGVLLLKKNKWGYIFAAPWLTFSILMGISIIVTMILMLFQDNKTAIVPLMMVSLIVCLSIATLYHFLFRSKIL